MEGAGVKMTVLVVVFVEEVALGYLGDKKVGIGPMGIVKGTREVRNNGMVNGTAGTAPVAAIPVLSPVDVMKDWEIGIAAADSASGTRRRRKREKKREKELVTKVLVMTW
jgi:hypothetical protein